MREGALFRNLRKDRGLSLQQISDELNSVAFISKFEKGDSNISVHRLERLLENINVTIEEFFYLRGQEDGAVHYENILAMPNYMTSRFLDYFEHIRVIHKETNEQKGGQIRGIEKLATLQSTVTGNARWQKFIGVYAELLKMIYQTNSKAEQGDNSIETEALFIELYSLARPVVRYLYQVDNWGIFEVFLFRFFQFSFPIETSHQLLKTALSRTEKEMGLSLMREIRMDLVFSCFTSFINFRQFKWAKEALVYAEKNLQDSGDLLNSTNLLFYQGWYQIIKGEPEKGIEKCQQATSIFRILKQPKYVEYTKDTLAWILKNAEQPTQYFVFR